MKGGRTVVEEDHGPRFHESHDDVGSAVPTNLGQTVDDIGFNLIALHRAQMVAGNHTLAQLFKARFIVNARTEFRLTQQEDLEER